MKEEQDCRVPQAREGRPVQKRYGATVIILAVAERARGRTWNEVKKAVKDRFEREPSERQMRTWWNRYGVDSEARSKAVEVLAEQAVEEAVKRMVIPPFDVLIKPLIPIMRGLIDLGVPPDDAKYMSILADMDRLVGRERFDHLVKAFQECRGRLPMSPNR